MAKNRKTVIVEGSSLKEAVEKAAKELNTLPHDVAYTIEESGPKKERKKKFLFFSTPSSSYTIKAWASSLLESVLSHGDSSHQLVSEIEEHVQLPEHAMPSNKIVVVKHSGIFVRLYQGFHYDADILSRAFQERGVLAQLEERIPEILQTQPHVYTKFADYTGDPASASSLTLTFNEDKTEAFLTMSRPQVLGSPTSTYQEVIDFLELQKVIYGIQFPHIRGMVEEEIVEKPILIAIGKPYHGKDQHMYNKYYLQEKASSEPSEQVDSKTSFLDIKASVCKYRSFQTGEVVCERVSLEKDIEGKDVFGNPIGVASSITQETRLKAGSGIHLSEDGQQYFAEMDGFVIEENATIYMTSTLHIKENISYNTGHIDVIGDVSITGDVQAGFIVKSTGSITIDGFVQQGSIIAKKDVSVSKGIIGARIRCKGSLKADYITLSRLDVLGDILCSKDMVNNRVYCLGYLLLYGDKSRFIGGEGIIKKGLMTKKLGSNFSKVSLTIGSDFRIILAKESLIQLQQNLQLSVQQAKDDLKRLSINRPQEEANPKTKSELIETIQASKHKIELLDKEIIRLKQFLKNEKKHGFVSCKFQIYPGVSMKLNGYDLDIYDKVMAQTIKTDKDQFKVEPYSTEPFEKEMLSKYNITTRR